MTIIYANITTNPADLRAAANAQGLTPTQFVAWATNNAVETWRREETVRLEFIAALDATIKEQYAIRD